MKLENTFQQKQWSRERCQIEKLKENCIADLSEHLTAVRLLLPRADNDLCRLPPKFWHLTVALKLGAFAKSVESGKRFRRLFNLRVTEVHFASVHLPSLIIEEDEDVGS